MAFILSEIPNTQLWWSKLISSRKFTGGQEEDSLIQGVVQGMKCDWKDGDSLVTTHNVCNI